MNLRQIAMSGVLCALAVAGSAAQAQAQSETYTANATVKGASGASASVPVTIVIDRKMPQSETDAALAAFKSGGAAGLHKALAGVKPTGSVQLGNGKPTPTRLTLERPTDKGHLLTIVCDQPILFVGAGVPGAAPKEGYDFAIIDLVVDAKGSGTGTMAPAAKVSVKQGVVVVEDYAKTEMVKLEKVTKVK